MHELARRLTDRFDVVVLAPHAAGAATEEIRDGVRVLRYRYAPARLETLVNHGGILANLRRSPWKWLLLPPFLLFQGYALRLALRRFRPDVVHAHWLLPQGLVALYAARRVPVLVTSHGADLFGLNGRAFALIRKAVINRVAALSVVSRAMLRRVHAEVPQARVHVLPMGVDCRQRFCPDHGAQVEDALLFVGRLVEKKGLHNLIEAMPAVLAARPSASLDVVGFGPERAKLERRVAELNLQERIRFLGALPQEQLPSYYRKASLFVAPFIEASGGDQEGLGLVVAEAMACGCPVVVGDVAGVRDLVGDDTGVIVPAANHATLAAAVVDLLVDTARREQLATRGRAHVLRHFDWVVATDAYARLLNLLIIGAPP